MSACKIVFSTESGTWLFIKRIFQMAVLCVMGSLLISCATPVFTGPFYKPIYAEKERGVWSYRKGDRVLLNFKFAGCILRFNAGMKDETLEFYLYQTDFSDCQVRIRDGAFVFEDLDTGSRREIDTFERTFNNYWVPSLAVDRAVELSSMIPGFAAVPASEQRYILSLVLEREFKSALPQEAIVQIPDFQLGERQYQLPPFRLVRYERSGTGWWYVPASIQEPVPTKPAGKMLGGGYAVIKPPDTLYEEKSTIRVSTSFRGWKRDGVSSLNGIVYFEIFGDKPVQLLDSHVAWRVHSDTEERLIPVTNKDWGLKSYTTRHLSERLGHLSAFDGAIPEEIFQSPVFKISIPNYRPERLKVTLPRVDVDGREWPIPSLEFEYRSSGFDVDVWPWEAMPGVDTRETPITPLWSSLAGFISYRCRSGSAEQQSLIGGVLTGSSRLRPIAPHKSTVRLRLWR